MRLVSEHTIDKVSFLYAIIVVAVMVVSIGSLFIYNKFSRLSNDLVLLEKEFIREQKEKLRADVNSLIARIDTSRLGARERLQRQLRNRVEEAIAIAANLYNTNIAGKGEAETANIIREALRPVRFNDGQSYYFILNLQKNWLLHPIDPAVEGVTTLQSSRSNFAKVSEQFVNLVESQGAGYIRYDYPKPGEDLDKLFSKISYVASFKPLQWIIGTGAYHGNLDTLAQNDIIRELKKNLRFYATDYYFIYQLLDLQGGDGFATMLINSNVPELEGEKLSDDYVDTNGKAFRKEMLAGLRNDGDAFVVYSYQKPDSSETGRKLAFFKIYPPWNWIVARGVYFDRLDQTIAAQKQALSLKVKKDVVMLCLFFLAAVTIALFVAYHFSRQLQAIFDRYRKNQEDNYSKLERLHEALKEQSRMDALTGAFNRGYFNQQLAWETSRADRYASPLNLILFDVDNFKKLNDTFGHLVGDTVLQTMTELIRNNIRQSDILARWGGEEFAILAPGVDLKEARGLGEKLRLLVEEQNFQLDMPVTCSFGITSYRPPEDTSKFLQRADDALYRAKKQGRNRCTSA